MEGEKTKNDLVLFLAHDLKTPLTSIVAYLTMLDRSSGHAGRGTRSIYTYCSGKIHPSG